MSVGHRDPAPLWLVMAKEPVAGRVKTRLCPPLSPAQAAGVAAAALADTLDVLARLPARGRVLVLDGRPGPWVPTGFTVRPQVGGGLDERLAAAFADAAAEGPGPVVVLGMDTPQVLPADLELPPPPGPAPHAWFGPAADGGFWCLGLSHPDPALLLGVAMSRADTGDRQRRRLLEAGLGVTLLRPLRDVDTVADLFAVAALAPRTRFAAAVRDLPVLSPAVSAAR